MVGIVAFHLSDIAMLTEVVEDTTVGIHSDQTLSQVEVNLG